MEHLFENLDTGNMIKLGNSCDHLAWLSSDHLAWLSSDRSQIPDLDTPCNRCDHLPEKCLRQNWLCLFCKVVLCSRYVNGHMVRHYQQTNHFLALGYDTLEVWCFSCHSYLNVEVISQLQPLFKIAYRQKFGQNPPFLIAENSNKEDNQADGCKSEISDQKGGEKQSERREKKSFSESNDSPSECRSTEGASGAIKGNLNGLKFHNRRCFCGKEATMKLSLNYTCKENKCDFLECCFNNEAQDADNMLPGKEALQNQDMNSVTIAELKTQIMNLVSIAELKTQIMNLVSIAELKTDFQGLITRFNVMESNFGLMKMMILMNTFYGFMLIAVIIVMLFKH